MLNDGGNENGKTNTQTKKKQPVSLATTTTLHVQHTSFFAFLCRCLERLQRETF